MIRLPLFVFAFLLALLAPPLVMRGAEPVLVDIQKLDPTIVVDLRYASARNVAGRPLYPPDMAAMVHPEIADRLIAAQSTLRGRGFRLKIWDAYRPKEAHEQLWRSYQNTDYVADPAAGGSLHTWGIAVDATMVDSKGREVKMPTDFDDFTPAAMLYYIGPDQNVRRHLRILQNAMGRAGFYGLRTEWWHFVAKGWKNFQPTDGEILTKKIAAPQKPMPLQTQVQSQPQTTPLRATPANSRRDLSTR